ncbi:MAG: ABC transporter permease subunit [Desulfobulbaceae bacterium]|nr:ABC transporter permease subunit [Desulfobulbaceae bacterium]
MKAFNSLFKRELYAYFLSPVAYAVLGVFLLLCGYFFSRSIAYFSYLSVQAGYDTSLQAHVNVHELILRPLFSSITLMLIFLIPLLTMRTFSEEKKQGTLELLLSYPTSDTVIILAKNGVCLLVVLTGLLGTAIYPAIIFALSHPDTGPIFTGYLGLVFLAASLVSIGTLFSIFTENQTVAAVSAFGVILLLWSLAWFVDFVPGVLGVILNELSIQSHFQSFARGQISTRDVIYFINITIIFNVLAIQALKRGIRCR